MGLGFVLLELVEVSNDQDKKNVVVTCLVRSGRSTSFWGAPTHQISNEPQQNIPQKPAYEPQTNA